MGQLVSGTAAWHFCTGNILPRGATMGNGEEAERMELVPAFWQFNHRLHKDPSCRFLGSTTRLLEELKHHLPSPKYPHDG